MRCGVHLIHSYSAGLASRLASLAVTAADPSYPGAHSTISAAGSSVLAAFFGDRAEIDVTSDALPGTVRSFASYRPIATEAGLSRRYAGRHTPLDDAAGLQRGAHVAPKRVRAFQIPGFWLRLAG